MTLAATSLGLECLTFAIAFCLAALFSFQIDTVGRCACTSNVCDWHMTGGAGGGGGGEWVLCQRAKRSGIIELFPLGLKQNLFHK